MHRWLNDDSRTFLERGYLQPGQSAEQRIREIADTAETILGMTGFAKKFEDYMHAGYISLSSPVWSNFGTDRGLPISCNNSYFEDTTESILLKTAEIGMQTKFGAGTSAFLGALRPRGAPIRGGGASFGPIHFMEMLETTTNIISQSTVRRGSCAVYLPVEHPDIHEFLDCREEGSPIQRLSLGVCISDAWMKAMVAGDQEKRKLWMRILQKRFETGYPYIFWTNTVNNGAPEVYRNYGMKIHSSNLCSEIALASSAEESFVCNLASMNLLWFDEWKKTDVAQTLVYFLDAVMSEYIEKTEGVPLMQTARNFAMRQRAIGIGSLGWHSYLQSNMIPFESMQAKLLNTSIHSFMQGETLEASQRMAKEYGEPELLKGYGRRHVTLMSIAPTTSSSFILGQVSPSIEPLDSNYFVKDLQKGKFTYRNPYLQKVLADHAKDDEDTWRSILLKGGSVQHLDFLTDNERAVFKTFGEISQHEIIVQAAGRQNFIDQSQSLNLKIHPETPLRDVNQLMISAWELGVKTLYYQRSTNPAQEYVRNLLSCVSCEA
ncbi:ribonucleoside-diphosphate reductase subunit alpha [Bradyrhizobium elkanii]|uniref:Ribonucleoside-diphosphate reductase alpha chain n=1 Tax=Bradyrhizobium elkanii TaxID=29448 RepID=A0ABV4F074_BRAEL|nr:ribonucleoside-diphosphate reductase subunit alpha [Bradyrhizobium elkanii]MCP1757722.1 ribonucleoside-diphosphate reductase alpha chain [Bradyrhizobium elkanii]MCS3881981.1 ribonucleoside-diphosphate reductase alpha chain [Bradyrhizobium elkanii]MCS4218741.1 ribonucleoside-diphosphate reductase alpha chain [Bradyrhizobium elkanii]MCW2109951.1 ribonucleoside-diphosphate reductase alpha chain [Bradyrhizobium elkanii]MCW2201675.1 ribonucleoside-diphosphate reductase alpha chain [Bradyrhizobiu